MNASIVCELFNNVSVNEEFFILEFIWDHPSPQAGQFFLLRPERTSVFLARPISIFDYNPETKIVKFLIVKRGKGTVELSQLSAGEKVRLTGPSGNTWAEFLPESQTGKIALVGGSAGVAPLAALIGERPEYNFHLFAGFRQGFREKDEEDAILGAGTRARKVVITAEDGKNALIGRVVDFIVDLESYDLVFGCGPMPMMNALKKKCETKHIPCYLSIESRIACGVGACHGCTINTVKGNKRCCKDGPIFLAGDVVIDE